MNILLLLYVVYDGTGYDGEHLRNSSVSLLVSRNIPPSLPPSLLHRLTLRVIQRRTRVSWRAGLTR